MHPYRKPTREEWTAFVLEVERLLGQQIFNSHDDPDAMLMIYRASKTACGEGASPQAFANVLKGRMH
jgi:hypothetical protein